MNLLLQGHGETDDDNETRNGKPGLEDG